MTNGRSFVLKALTRIMRPLVKVLIRYGVSFKACADVIKWCYVDVATRDFALAGKRQTKSRVTVITGLTWVEVSRLQAQTAPGSEGHEEQYHRATRVLTAWSQDDRFQNADGEPMELPLDKTEISFATLVSDYSGGATIKSVLDDLLYNGAVEEVEKGVFRLLRRYYLTTDDPDKYQSIGVLGMCAGDLISTIEWNIRPDQAEPRYHRAVFQRNLPLSALPEARQFIEVESQVLADKVDQKLASLASKYDSPLEETHVPHVGLGLYYFQTPNHIEKSKGKTS